jgi:hypothetical protein
MPRNRKNAIQEQQVNVEPAAAEGAAEVAEPTTPANAEATKAICLTPNCGREAKIRALCGRCCTAARKAVKDGKTTWEQLEAMGLAKPPKHNVIGGKGVFAAALEKALGNKIS